MPLTPEASVVHAGCALVEHLRDRGEHMIWANEMDRRHPHKAIPQPTLKRFIETWASDIPASDLSRIIELFGDEIGKIELNNGQTYHERLEDLLALRGEEPR